MHKIIRYLRIAFSAVCGIACALLIVLWVRSYAVGYQTTQVLRERVTQLSSVDGRVFILSMKASSSLDSPFEIFSDELGRPVVTDFFGDLYGFYFHHEDSSFIVVVPWWFILLSASISAAIPWLLYCTVLASALC
jgi:hypothetical protein